MRRQKQRQTELGAYLAAQREKSTETVSSLARKAQVAPSTVSDIELGNRRARPDTLRKLSGPLGIDPNELFVRAFLTPELRPRPITSTVQEELVNLTLQVTREEQRLLGEYLTFLQSRPLINLIKQNIHPFSG